MFVKVTTDVLKGLDAVRSSGLVNMFDRSKVIYLAEHFGYSETARWIKHNKYDLLSDARVARQQAANGPYYPKRGITKESLLKWADTCDKKIAELRKNNEHNNSNFSY